MWPLTTSRLTIAPIAPTDAPDMAALAGDYDVICQTGSWPWPMDPEETLARCSAGFGPKGGWLVARAEGDLVGIIGISGEGEFGYMLARDHWGHGYATEMGRAVRDYAFANGWPVLRACVFEGNPASVGVLAKLGFTEGAPCRGYSASRKGEFPTRTFELKPPQG